jgi:hypothetical protein
MASSLVPINFIIDNFNTEIQLDVCGNLFKSVVTMDASAVADLKVDASLVRLAFQIQTDASDVINTSSADIKYFIDRNSFWGYDISNSFAINASDAQMNHADTTVKIMDSTSVPTKNMVCHDFVRFLAMKLFNTPYGVDLFNNEQELLDDIRNKSQKVWTTIDKELTKYDVTDRPTLSSSSGFGGVNYESQVAHAGIYGPSGWKYYINSDTGNISKKLLDQMAEQNPARLQNIQNTTDIQSLPLISGDTISLKLTVTPADKQEMLTDVPVMGARSFRIRYNLVDDYAITHVGKVARAGDENDLYREFNIPFTAPPPGPSAPSAPDSTTIFLSDLGSGEMLVEWTEVSGADSYEIRYTISGSSLVTASIPSGVTGYNLYNILGLAPGTYDVEIRATNAHGSSPYSSPVVSVVIA